MFFANPKHIIFYEKTGCSGNQRQKELLKKHHISLDVRSLLETTWDEKSLAPFFEGLSVTEMINPFAPQVTNKELDVSQFSKEALIAKMIQEPLLIKRPLLQIGEHKICGFDIAQINTLLGTSINSEKNINACLSSDNCTK